MSDALREQLLKAGLANEKQLKHTKKALQQERQQRRKANKQGKDGGEDPHKQRLAEERRRKVERDRELNRQKEAEKRQKSLRAQIEELLKRHGQSTRDGDIPFHFTQENKIRKLEVTQAQQRELSQGQLAIVRHEGRYHLVPTTVSERLLERDPTLFVYRVDLHGAEGEDDALYRQFPIPDDLRW